MVNACYGICESEQWDSTVSCVMLGNWTRAITRDY